jgi:acetyltransferase-like isoleucine patch superfamily enzyme
LKALREIGLARAVKFGFLTIFYLLYKVMIFPQLRVVFLRFLGAKIGRNVIIHNVEFFNLYRGSFAALEIGDNCFLGNQTLIDLATRVKLEMNVTLAERVSVLTHMNVGYSDHPLQKYFPAHSKPVLIREGCFIGACATILAGVEIGRCSFVGAGSVVTEDIPPWTLVAGVPARVIRQLDELKQPKSTRSIPPTCHLPPTL